MSNSISSWHFKLTVFSKHIARLWVTVIGICGHWPERHVNDSWVTYWSYQVPENTIFQLILDDIEDDAARKDDARYVFLWIACGGPNRADRLLKAMSWKFESGDLSDPAVLRDQLEELSTVCGGLITFCGSESSPEFYMDPRVERWLFDKEMWKGLFPLGNSHIACQHMHASLAEQNAVYIMLAYGNGTPCPNDASMDQLLARWPLFEEDSNNLSYHLRNIKEVEGTLQRRQWSIIYRLFFWNNAGYLPCIKQVQQASMPKKGFQGWSQRFPDKVSPLVYAASEGLDIIIQRLLRKGWSGFLESVGSDGRTALGAAANNGHLSTVQLLLRE